MKKTSSKMTLPVTLMTLAVLCSCGGLFSPNICGRINGTWDVEKYLVNGADSTDFLKSDPNYCHLTIKCTKSYPDFSDIVSCNKGGSWGFEHDGTEIGIFFYPDSTDPGNGPYRADSIVTWKIEELKWRKMTLSTTFKGKNYTAFFRKKPYKF